MGQFLGQETDIMGKRYFMKLCHSYTFLFFLSYFRILSMSEITHIGRNFSDTSSGTKKLLELFPGLLASMAVNYQRTVMGRIMSVLARECMCEVGDLTASQVEKSLSYFTVLEEETWRLGPLLELTADDL
jgi:hypothetical protein